MYIHTELDCRLRQWVQAGTIVLHVTDDSRKARAFKDGDGDLESGSMGGNGSGCNRSRRCED